MKRSTNLRLSIMALAIPAALAGCDAGPPSGAVIASLDDCKANTDVPIAQCEAAYQKALAEHERVAPRFESAEECNAQFGNCNANSNGAYVPPMTGFLLGYVMAGGFNRNGGMRDRSIAAVSPLYRDYQSGGYLKPNGDMASNRPGQVSGSRGNATPPARAITVSRSGFGSSASARGSFGS